VTRDITDRHDAELALQSQTRTLELLGAVASASNSAAGVEDALTATLESFCEFGGWQLAHAYLTDHDPSALRHSVWHEETPGSFAGFRAATEATPASEVSLPRSVLSSPAPVWLPSLEGDVRFRRATQAGLVAACAFPILVRDEPVGVLEFFSTQPHDCRADMLQVMQQFGAQLGRVVERERVELRLARHATQLEGLSNRLETVLNSAGEGIYGLDAHGTVTFINDAGARLIGLPRDRIVGRAAQDVIHTETEPGYVEDVEAPSSDGFPTTATPRLLTGRHRRTDGTLFDSESISAPIVQDSAVVGSVVVFRDVSGRRAVERLKDQFISVVSHELRTPLTGIRGALGLLAGGAAGPLSPRAARMVEVGTTSADRLIRLITDILDLERMTAGHLTAHPRTAEAGPLIAAAVEEIAVVAAGAEVSITVGNTPGAVLADPDRVIQILSNLIGNAVKFSGPGSAVELSTIVLDEHVRFDVADHGPGIPADQLEEIFQPFRQADASDTRRHGGTGLGLAICRSIVEQHNGRIWASCKPGVGATFSFTLPRGDQPLP
jgi:PAS domain S-box-containing protein